MKKSSDIEALKQVQKMKRKKQKAIKKARKIEQAKYAYDMKLARHFRSIF